MSIQLKGTCSLAPAGDALVAYSNQITQMTINQVRTTVTEPATLGTGREVSKAGVMNEELVIDFFSDLAAASIWAVLWDTIQLDEPLIDFLGVLGEGAVGPDNPSFGGTATLLSLTTGNAVGSLRTNQITLPITGAGVTKLTS